MSITVAFDTNNTLSAPGGAATYFLELLPELLAQAGESDRFYVLSADDSDAAPLPWLLRNEQLHGVHAPFGSGALWRNLSFPAVERLVREPGFDGGLEVCHSFHPPLMPSRARCKVLTLLGLAGTEDGELDTTLRRSLKRADVVITPSRSLAALLEEKLAAAFPRADALDTRFVVVPPAVHSRYLDPPKAANVEKLCTDFAFLEEPYLLAAGAACEPQRNAPLLIEAYAIARAEDSTLPDLVMVAPHHEVETLSALVARREGLQGAIPVMSQVSTEELPALYTGSEFLLHPGLDHTYGLSVLEAAAAGVPAVVGQQSGVLETLGSSLVVPADDSPRAWAASILGLHRDGALRSTRTEEARVRARTGSWATVASQHWDIYRGT